MLTFVFLPYCELQRDFSAHSILYASAIMCTLGAARYPTMHFCFSKWQKEQRTYFTTSQDLAYALIIEMQPLSHLYMYSGMFCRFLEE